MNRRLGARRFLKVPDLRALKAALARVRLPWAARSNRRRMFSGRPPREASARADVAGAGSIDRTQHGSRSRSLAKNVLGFLAFAAPLAAAIAAFAVPLFGVRAYEYVMRSGYFHVREVVVDQTAGDATPHLSREELLRIAGIDENTHVLEADLQRMTQRLIDDPWVRWAKVERELPDRLVVHVVEHAPSAYLAAGELYLVDELGTPFALAPADHAAPLTVISGIDAARIEATASDPHALDDLTQELASALNIARIWRGQGLARRYPIGELRLHGGGDVTLVLEARAAGTPTEIVLGRGPFREKLFRAEWVLEHLRSLGKTAEYVLLDLADEAPGALDMGGARVVVKTDLGGDAPRPSADTATDAAPPAAAPPSAPRPRPANARPAARPAPAHANANMPAPEDPALGPDPSPEPDPATDAESAPLSGGRPAQDPNANEE